MSWDISSILFDKKSVQGNIKLVTEDLDVSFADMTSVTPFFPAHLDCKVTRSGLSQCTYDSFAAGESAPQINQNGNYCCNDKYPLCSTQKGGFNYDCPQGSHILFQKMISNKSKVECETPPFGGPPICIVDASSTSYKGCGNIDCVSTCSLGNATARCIQGISDPIPKCLSTCPTSGSCAAQSCFVSGGKCGSGDFWQSAGNLENMSSGWIVCEFYFDFGQYTRARQGELLNWMTDLFQYKSSTKPSLLPDFSVPLVMHALVYQTVDIFFRELYSSEKSAFTSVPFLSKSSLVTPYVLDIIKPISVPLSLTNISQYTDIGSLVSTLSDENVLGLPHVWSSGDGIDIRVSPAQFDLLSKLSPTAQAQEMTSYMRNILKDEETRMTVVSSDGIPTNIDSPRCTFTSYRVQDIVVLQMTKLQKLSIVQRVFGLNASPSVSYSWSIRTIPFTEAGQPIPESCFVVAYTVSCGIGTFSPALQAYICSRNRCPDTVVPRMYADTNLYPYAYAMSNLSESERDEQCRKQIRNPVISQTVNEMGRLLYGYYSPDCKCIISNIAPVDELQFMNRSSMCFDYNCNSPQYSARYNLEDNNCGTPTICQDVKGWGARMQNTQNFDATKYATLCGSREKRGSEMDIVLLVLGIVLTLLVGSFVFLKDIRKKKSRIALVAIVSVVTMTLSVFLSKDLFGVPVCRQSVDGKPYTACTTSLSGFEVPPVFCRDRYKWCECFFDTDKCICKSGILVPRTGEVDISETIERKWNPAYGVFVMIITTISIWLSHKLLGQQRYGIWTATVLLLLIGAVSQTLCITPYTQFKNNSDC